MARQLTVQALGDLGVSRARAIHERFPGVHVSTEAMAAPADALLAWELEEGTLREVLERSPDLAWMHLRWAGVPAWLVHVLEPYPELILTNGSGAHGAPIAEFVVGGLLAFSRRLFELRELQQRAEWAAPFRSIELRGRTAGILGLGDVGGSIARVLRPFGVHLIGFRRGEGSAPGVDETHTFRDLRAVLPRLDVLIIAAPLTRETRGLLGADALGLLPRGALLVNVGRGPIVDEAALIEALADGHLGGAILEVFEREPLPADSPLWRLPNVLISPHAADHTDATLERALELYLDNLGRFLRGEPLRNVVDRARGY